MSVYAVNPSTGELSRVAGGTLYADAPIGEIHAFGGSVVPSGYLLCDGQAVSRTTYAELFSAIGTAFGAGNGSTTFNVPDLREATTKGVGLSGKSGNHYGTDGVALGEFIDDRIQNHTHYYATTDFGCVTGDGSGAGIRKPPVNGDVINARTGETTEVKAVGVNYIIKAKQVAVPFDLIPTINKGKIVGKLDYGLGYTKNVYSIATTYTGEITTGQSLGVINDIDRIISIDGTFIQDGDPVKYRQFPYQDQYGYTATIEIQRVSTTSLRIVVYKSDNWTLRDANIMVLYTKTTD